MPHAIAARWISTAARLVLQNMHDFTYVEHFLSADEESEIASRLSTLTLAPLRMHGVFTKRRIASFGLDYRTGARTLADAAPLPDWLLPVRDRAATAAGLQPASLEQALVTEYPAGAAIGWHIDHAQFGDTIVAISLLGRAVMQLRPIGGPTILRQELAPRSLYLLGPTLRYEHHHRVVCRDYRISITLRSIKR